MGILAWWLDETHGLQFHAVGLFAFAIELPIFWLLKTVFSADIHKNFPP